MASTELVLVVAVAGSTLPLCSVSDDLLIETAFPLAQWATVAR